VAGIDRLNDLEYKLLLKSQNIVQCVKCQAQFGFERGDDNSVVKDAKGSKLEGYQLPCNFQGAAQTLHRESFHVFLGGLQDRAVQIVLLGTVPSRLRLRAVQESTDLEEMPLL
jgi:hypothetical protein